MIRYDVKVMNELYQTAIFEINREKYMVHVKDRLRKIEQFKGKIREVERVLELLTQEVVIEAIVLTSAIVEGLSRMEER